MYPVDYNIAVSDLFVPDKRTPRNLAFNRGLVASVALLHDNILGIYRNADYTLTPWNGSPVNRNDNVRYGKSIFQSTVDGNVSEPTMSDTWVLISDNYLGSDFRLAIRGEKLTLEYALNIWFETTFRQPPLVSDIFITTNVIMAVPVFRVGISENESSSVSTLTSSELVINDYAFTDQYNGAINIPLAVYNALGATDDVRESIVRSFADKYVDAAIIYQIVTY